MINSPEVPTVESFLRSKFTNLWVREPGYDIYVRKSTRLHPTSREQIRAFDLANILASKPGTGKFSATLANIEQIVRDHDFQALYVENVLTDQFASYFYQRPEWIETTLHFPNYDYFPCFMKLL